MIYDRITVENPFIHRFVVDRLIPLECRMVSHKIRRWYSAAMSIITAVAALPFLRVHNMPLTFPHNKGAGSIHIRQYR